jgi:hypothetical protein
MGRVRVSRARREALLNEFERGGISGAQFADYVGSNIRPSPLGFKSDSGAKRLGLGLPIRAGVDCS